jgi:hypothetical protein
MTGRIEHGVPAPSSLRGPAAASSLAARGGSGPDATADPADTFLGPSPRAAPASTLETDMHLVPEQMARSHLENRRREAELWRVHRAARAIRRAEAAERRARLAREAAVLAVRQSAGLAAR